MACQSSNSYPEKGTFMNIGILGVGALTEKIVVGLHQTAGHGNIILSPRNCLLSRELHVRFGCAVAEDNQAVVDQSDVILIGVRPENLDDLTSGILMRPDPNAVFRAGFSGYSRDRGVVRPGNAEHVHERLVLLPRRRTAGFSDREKCAS